MSLARRALAGLVLGLGASLALAAAAAAQSAVSSPSISIDRAEAAVGEAVIVTVSGFDARPVTISVCGNEARRGSADCDMRGSRARETQPDSPVGAELVVDAPPMPCPCVVRASTQDNSVIAVASLVIIGHPVADVVGSSPTDQPLVAAVVAEPAPTGLSQQLRSSLGGSSRFDLTIRVTNTASFEIGDVAVAAAFTRARFDDTRDVDVPSAGALAPGQTWEHTVRVEVPSLTFGDVEWTATASGQGPPVTATDRTSSFPVLLVVFGLVLLVDLSILLGRAVARVRRRRPGDDGEPWDNPFIDAPDPDDRDASQRQPQLVG